MRISQNYWVKWFRHFKIRDFLRQRAGWRRPGLNSYAWAFFPSLQVLDTIGFGAGQRTSFSNQSKSLIIKYFGATFHTFQERSTRGKITCLGAILSYKNYGAEFTAFVLFTFKNYAYYVYR